MRKKKLIGQLSKMERDKIAVYTMKVRGNRGKNEDKPVCNTCLDDPSGGIHRDLPNDVAIKKLPNYKMRPRVRLCPVGYKQVY